MNTATLTTTSGHTWATSISAPFEETRDYFLGKFFQVGSYDETKPNEGFTSEQVVKIDFKYSTSDKATLTATTQPHNHTNLP